MWKIVAVGLHLQNDWAIACLYFRVGMHNISPKEVLLCANTLSQIFIVIAVVSC